MAADKGSDNPHRELDSGAGTIRSLRAAVDAVRNRKADQRDVVVDLGEAERAALRLARATQASSANREVSRGSSW